MSSILIPGSGAGGVSSSELTATAGDVLKGAKYVGQDTNDDIGTGTLELTGNATTGDVLANKTFYINNPKSKQTGTLALSGNAAANRVLSPYTFYSTNPKTKLTGTIPSYSGRTITPGTSNQTIAAGNYLSGNVVIAGDGDLIAANIKNGKNIFGVNGTCKEIVISTKILTYSGSSYRLYKADGVSGNFYRLVIGAIDFTPCLIIALCGIATTTMAPNINGLSNLTFNVSMDNSAQGHYADATLGSNKNQFSVNKSNIVIPVLSTGSSDHTYWVDIVGFR